MVQVHGFEQNTARRLIKQNDQVLWDNDHFDLLVKNFAQISLDLGEVHRWTVLQSFASQGARFDFPNGALPRI